MSFTEAPSCAECGSQSERAGGYRIYPHRRDLYGLTFWLCACGAYCGCHPGSDRPLGRPAGAATRRARSDAHKAFDRLWKGGRMTRRKAYRWLRNTLGITKDEAHIGMMDEATARKTEMAALAELARSADG